MRPSTRALAAFAVATLLAAGPAHAAAILSLYNTGVDAAHVVQANGVTDLHYALDGVAGDARVATQANGYPNNVWIGDDAVSAWIGPVSGGPELNGGLQFYDYRTTFDLTGLNHLTAAITGRWAVDDAGTEIRLNGVSIGASEAPWNTWTSFSISSGFVAGINTLDFVVRNDNFPAGPTGLRVEMTGSADALTSGAPEPSAWAMMLAGFGGLGALLRRRRSALA